MSHFIAVINIFVKNPYIFQFISKSSSGIYTFKVSHSCKVYFLVPFHGLKASGASSASTSKDGKSAILLLLSA